jgi:hypothetical protein
MSLWPRERSPIDLELDTLFRRLKAQDVQTKEYATILDHIVTLHGLRKEEKDEGVSKDTWATIGANLVGIFMIIKHEHVNVVTSRAFSLLMRP